jgi:Na+/alanine symporter
MYKSKFWDRWSIQKYNGAQNVSVVLVLQSAMDSVFPGFGSYVGCFIFLCLYLLAYYYIAETNILLDQLEYKSYFKGCNDVSDYVWFN